MFQAVRIGGSSTPQHSFKSTLSTPRPACSLQRPWLLPNRKYLLLRAAEIEDQVNSNGFFTDAFRAALATAVSREGGLSNGNQAPELQHNDGMHNDGNGNGHREVVYEPITPRVQEVSASEEVLLTTLQQCHANLATFTMMQRQLDAIIDREKRQVERLAFALEKCRMDAAYYRTLEALAANRYNDN